MFQSAVFPAESLPLAELLLKAFSQNVSAVAGSEAREEKCAVSPTLKSTPGFSFAITNFTLWNRNVICWLGTLLGSRASPLPFLCHLQLNFSKALWEEDFNLYSWH